VVSELLLILSLSVGASVAPPALPMHVVQSVSPRVLLVRVTPEIADQLRTDPNVEFLTAGAVPPEIVATLTPTESLFVNAWNMRIAKSEKSRPGEGLSWDAPGFEPPDGAR
jgi:hypothetical protein